MRVAVRDQGGGLWVSAGEAISLEGEALAAHASHELRTPLTMARAEIEAAARGDAGSARALAALDHLSDLVESLLWFARAQNRLDGSLMAAVNVADLVRGQVANCRSTAYPWSADFLTKRWFAATSIIWNGLFSVAARRARFTLAGGPSDRLYQPSSTGGGPHLLAETPARDSRTSAR